VFIAAVIGFIALALEKDDLHRLLLLDLIEIPALGVIALLGTDLAEALILPGLVVGIAELLALSQIYLAKEGLRERPVRGLHIEVIDISLAPVIISVLLVVYGLILSGFTVAGLQASV
jgi:energy-converting hydrogenase A subunit G